MMCVHSITHTLASRQRSTYATIIFKRCGFGLAFRGEAPEKTAEGTLRCCDSFFVAVGPHHGLQAAHSETSRNSNTWVPPRFTAGVFAPTTAILLLAHGKLFRLALMLLGRVLLLSRVLKAL